jgi:hypothetical protein
MANKISHPYFVPGSEPTFHAAVAVLGARFAKLHATAGDGNFGCQPATAGSYTVGVVERDTVLGGAPLIWGSPGIITDVEAGTTITAGDALASDSLGRAVPASGVASSAAVAATVDTGVVADNNALRWTANDAGNAGNGISVTILGSTGNSVSLSVAVNANDIVVTPATNGGGTITSTAAQVDTAVAASADANSLVAVTNAGASSGAGTIAAVSVTSLAGGADPVATAHVAAIAFADATVGNLVPVKLV